MDKNIYTMYPNGKKVVLLNDEELKQKYFEYEIPEAVILDIGRIRFAEFDSEDKVLEKCLTYVVYEEIDIPEEYVKDYNRITSKIVESLPKLELNDNDRKNYYFELDKKQMIIEQAERLSATVEELMELVKVYEDMGG